MLAGPTASGKSAAALRLAERFGLDIVSADSMQVYVGMDVGTAKPSAEERARVRHHLVDVVTPAEPFSVADYVRAAEAAIGSVLAEGRSALVTGGTGFYLRALRSGLPTVPPADPEAQAPLWRMVEAGRLEELIEELAVAAPQDAERAVLARYPQQPTALQGIGYKEVAAHLRGEITEAEALEAVVVASRQYAKRQRTWFRREQDARTLHGFGDSLGEVLEVWARAVLAR